MNSENYEHNANDQTSDGWGGIHGSFDFIRGRRLRFRQGAYVFSDGGELPENELATVTGIRQAWQKWENKRAVTHVTPVGKPHPPRDEMGDTDPTYWPANDSGVSQDPWSHIFALYVRFDDRATDDTILLSSVGGRRAVVELGRAIQQKRAQQPFAQPNVRLTSERMKTRQGSTLKPLFLVEAWIEPDAPTAN
jgi:hypothetical protein